MSRTLIAIARFSVSHAKTTLLLTTIVTLVALSSMSRLTLSVDILETVPDRVPVASKLRSLEGYGSIEPVILAISGTTDNLEERIDLALELAERLPGLSRVKAVQGRFLSGDSLFLDASIADSLLLYLTPGDVERLPPVLTEEQIDRTVADNLLRLRSPLASLREQRITEDPLGLFSWVAEQVGGIHGRLTVRTQEGVLITADDAYVLMLIRPDGNPRDLDFATALLGDIGEQVRETLGDLGLRGTVGIGRTVGDSGALAVGLTGHAALVVDYQDLLTRDIRLISGVAFGTVLALFLIAFRRARALIVAGIPLVVGIVWTLGLAAVLIGRIDALTAASVPILCGLAIDFTIHLYNRYLEEIHMGRETLEAFMVAHSETGRGILAAAATTTWAFLALGLATLPGPRNLGRICAIGMPVCLAASLLLVPALTVVTSGLRRAPDRSRRLAGFGLAPLLRGVLRYPRTVLAIGAVCTALLSLSAMRSGLRDGIGNPPTMPSKQLLDDISRRVGARVEVIATLVRGNSWSAGLEAAARVEREFRRLTEDEGPLAWVVGPSRLLPPPTRQRPVLERLRRLREEGVIQPERVEHDLLAAMDRHGFRVDRHARAVASRVSALLSRERPLSLPEAMQSPIGDLLKEMLIEHDDGTVTAIVTTYARPGVGSSRMIESLEAGIERAGVAAELVGSRILSQQLKPIAYRDAKLAASIAAVGVVAILVVTFRSVLLAVVTFAPVLAGGVAAIGLMPLFSFKFDVVSVSMVPVILGIGIDDGIHIVHRFRASPHEDLVRQFRHTGRGVVITSLTSLVGFGSMMFADSPVMASAGLVVVFGVGATLVTAVTIVPALLKVTRGLLAG